MSDAQPYQVMPDLDSEKYERLKEDIANNGIEYPIILDGEGEIIDGHHRYEAWTDLGRDPDELPTRVVDDTSEDNYHRAYRANLLRRDLSDGTKREVVKQYLLEHPDRVAEDTQEAIAEDLGVSQGLIAQIVDDVGVKNITPNKLTTDEKREQVRTYVEDKPDASNREVAREVDCDVTHVTVGNWRDKWEIQEPTSDLDTFADSKSKAGDVFDVSGRKPGGTVDSGVTDSSNRVDTTDENDPEVDDDDDEHTVVDAATKQETDEWSSPRELVEPLNDAIDGFDLDPCSGAEQSPFADATFTESDDGLSQDWFGDVWVNPPYSEMADWTEKAAAEVKRGNVDSVVYLCKGDSSTEWWQAGAEQTAAICAIDHRLKFGDGENSAPFASHIFVFGDIDDDVRNELTNHGLLLEVKL